jgi:hypothetical protein
VQVILETYKNNSKGGQEFSYNERVTMFVVSPFNAVHVSETETLIGNCFQADVGELETTNIQSYGAAITLKGK